jgi:ArsR family transcriptional regulator
MDAKLAVEALSALAQEHRLAAFRLLVQAGQDGLPAGTIAETLGVAASSMSFHLAALAHAGLVTQQRRSRLIIYTAHYASMNALMAYLTQNCCGGVPCTPDLACPIPALGEAS